MAFLDADDFWFPQKLERQVTLMQANPRAGMIYGDTLYWYSWTGLAEDAARDYLPPLGVEPDTLIEPPHLLVAVHSERRLYPVSVQRHGAKRGAEPGGRFRGGILSGHAWHVRGSGVLRQGLPAVAGVCVARMLGQVSAARRFCLCPGEEDGRICRLATDILELVRNLPRPPRGCATGRSGTLCKVSCSRIAARFDFAFGKRPAAR